MLYTAYLHQGPAAIRYPRGTGPGSTISKKMQAVTIGKAVETRSGQCVAILNFGTLLPAAMAAAEDLNATVVDMRWVKPLDEPKILEIASQHELLVTLEENSIKGGAGSAVNELLASESRREAVLNLGLPDSFVHHGSPSEQLSWVHLDSKGITEQINQKLAHIGVKREDTLPLQSSIELSR